MTLVASQGSNSEIVLLVLRLASGKDTPVELDRRGAAGCKNYRASLAHGEQVGRTVTSSVVKEQTSPNVD